nr:ParB N-terminal domain-containing protein [Armatimonas sp.]
MTGSENTTLPTTSADGSLDGLETRVYRCKLTELSHLQRNARYMTGEQLRRLQENIRRDGGLTSVPLIYRHDDDDERIEILSGNHRVEAAVAAGITEGWVMEILTRLTPERRVAIQLSHNSITGQDDPSQLKALYDELDLDWKQYSGLTDDAFKMDPLDLTGLSLAGPTYEEITLLFLPEQADAFREAMQKFGKRKPTSERYAADLADWERLFDTIVKVKDSYKIMNTAIAMRRIIDLATERLDQLEEAISTESPETTTTTMTT